MLIDFWDNLFKTNSKIVCLQMLYFSLHGQEAAQHPSAGSLESSG